MTKCLFVVKPRTAFRVTIGLALGCASMAYYQVFGRLSLSETSRFLPKIFQ